MLKKIKKLFEPIDLTKGKVSKTLLLFAFPSLVSLLISTFLPLIDTLIIKYNAGEAAGNIITASNATGPIQSILFNFAFGCSVGFGAICANRKGANDTRGVKSAFYHSVFLTIVIGLFLSIITLLSSRGLIDLLKIDAAYKDRSLKYILTIASVFTFNALLNFLLQFLNSQGAALASCLFNVLTLLLHSLLTFIFSKIGLDVYAIALSYGVSQIIISISALVYTLKKNKYLKINSIHNIKICRNEINILMAQGAPFGFQWSVLFIGSFVQSGTINSFSYYATQSRVVTNQFESYITFPFSLCNSLGASFFAQNNGAKNYRRLKRGMIDLFVFCIAFYIPILIFTQLFVDYLPYIYFASKEVTKETIFYSSTYLRLISIFIICQGFIMISRAFLQAIKKPLLPFISGVLELFFRVMVCLVLPLWVSPNNIISNEAYVAVSFATPAAWLASTIFMFGFTIHYMRVFRKDEEYLKVDLYGNLINENTY